MEIGPSDNGLVIFIFMVLRYLVFAGPAFLIFYVLFKKKFLLKRIQKKFPKSKDYLREVSYSMLTLIIFTLIALLVFTDPVKKYTLIYEDFSEYGWGYAILSFIGILLIHDTYFYWSHRLMHHPKLFKIFHLVHHKSTNPSPWAAFSFHPLEAIVEAGIIIPIAFLLPTHYNTLLIFILFMTFYNVYGHLGYELYPKWVGKHWIGKWLNTSVNHNMHHHYYEGNYGLYFRFWDELMKTTHKNYEKEFDQITSNRKRANKNNKELAKA